MKRYKKILVVAPLACMLSAGMFTLPHAAHADSTVKTLQTSKLKDETPFTAAQLRQDITDRLAFAGKHLVPDDTEFLDAHVYGDIDVSKIQYGPISVDKNVKVDAQVDSYKDLGQTNLLTYNNDDGIAQQTANTPETTIKQTETSSYSNTEGLKLGASASFTMGVEIPMAAKESQTVTVSTEFNYTHSDTQTSSKETDVTFKSQPVVAAPGGTTTYYGSITTANFSGLFHGTKATIEDLGANVTIHSKDKDGHVWTGGVPLSSFHLYKIFKYGGKPVPSYLTLDDINQKVLINHDSSFKVTGQGGFYTQIMVKFTPKDKNAAPQTMPYEEYLEKVRTKTI